MTGSTLMRKLRGCDLLLPMRCRHNARIFHRVFAVNLQVFNMSAQSSIKSLATFSLGPVGALEKDSRSVSKYVTGPDAAVPLVNIFVAAVANAFGKTFSKPASHPYGTKKMSFEDKDFSYPEAYEQMKLLHTAAYLKLVEGGQKFKEQRERS